MSSTPPILAQTVNIALETFLPQLAQTVKTIGNILTSPKDPIAELEKSRLVYKIPCADCEFVIVDQTKRDLKSCVAEHKRAVKNAA